MGIPFTNLQLKKIASFGAVFVGGNVLLMHYLTYKRFHQSPYFTAAADALLSHKALVSYLGEPIGFGNPNLQDHGKNFSTEHEAQFEVPVKGSKTKGSMRFSAVRMPITETTGEGTEPVVRPWNLTGLEVNVVDRPNEKIVIVRKTDS